MKKSMTSLPFKGTTEQKIALDRLIADYKGQAGAMMPVLQKAQDIYGYLPEEVQKAIAQGLGVPYSEVFGVATFYSQFLLSPKGTYPVAVCLGTACYVKASGILMEKLQELLGPGSGRPPPALTFSLAAPRCIGACGLAPVLTIGEDVYGRLDPSQLPGILKKYQEA